MTWLDGRLKCIRIFLDAVTYQAGQFALGSTFQGVSDMLRPNVHFLHIQRIKLVSGLKGKFKTKKFLPHSTHTLAMSLTRWLLLPRP